MKTITLILTLLSFCVVSFGNERPNIGNYYDETEIPIKQVWSHDKCDIPSQMSDQAVFDNNAFALDNFTVTCRFIGLLQVTADPRCLIQTPACKITWENDKFVIRIYNGRTGSGVYKDYHFPLTDYVFTSANNEVDNVIDTVSIIVTSTGNVTRVYFNKYVPALPDYFTNYNENTGAISNNDYDFPGISIGCSLPRVYNDNNYGNEQEMYDNTSIDKMRMYKGWCSFENAHRFFNDTGIVDVDATELELWDTVEVVKIDTLINKDTIKINDTINIIITDTIINNDTIQIKDTINVKDTIITNDTIIVKDTIINNDTVIINEHIKIINKDTIYINITDTIICKDSSLASMEQNDIRSKPNVIMGKNKIIFSENINKFHIYNIKGVCIMSENDIGDTTIQLNKLSKGFYIIKYFIVDGKRANIFKFKL